MQLSIRIILGMILGIAAGFWAGPGNLPLLRTWLMPVGDLFIHLIKMVMAPVILASLVCGAVRLAEVKRQGGLGAKLILFYLSTTAIAVSLGIALAAVMRPGRGMISPLAPDAAPATFHIGLLNLAPGNPFHAMANLDMLQVSIFALLLGTGIALAGEAAKPVEAFFRGLSAVMCKIIDLVMQLAPLGVFALIAPVVALNGTKAFLPLATVIVTVYLGCILYMTVVYSGAVSIIGGMSPAKFFRGIFPAMLVAFSTCSSNESQPAYLACASGKLGMAGAGKGDGCLPLDATFNMDGTAIYQGVCALFVAQVYGIELGIGHYVVIVLIGTLASIGTAGVPFSGLIMLSMVLQSVGLPLEGIALIAGIDRLLDMIRTTVNTTGKAAFCIIASSDDKKYCE